MIITAKQKEARQESLAPDGRNTQPSKKKEIEMSKKSVTPVVATVTKRPNILKRPEWAQTTDISQMLDGRANFTHNGETLDVNAVDVERNNLTNEAVAAQLLQDIYVTDNGKVTSIAPLVALFIQGADAFITGEDAIRLGAHLIAIGTTATEVK